MVINGTDYGNDYNVTLEVHKKLHRGLKKFQMLQPEEVEKQLEDEYYLATGKKRPAKKQQGDE